MKKQELLNSISTLAGSIDPLVRAEQKKAIKVVVNKMLELIKKLK